jgi:hypothetical protein
MTAFSICRNIIFIGFNGTAARETSQLQADQLPVTASIRPTGFSKGIQYAWMGPVCQENNENSCQ